MQVSKVKWLILENSFQIVYYHIVTNTFMQGFNIVAVGRGFPFTLLGSLICIKFDNSSYHMETRNLQKKPNQTGT